MFVWIDDPFGALHFRGYFICSDPCSHWLSQMDRMRNLSVVRLIVTLIEVHGICKGRNSTVEFRVRGKFSSKFFMRFKNFAQNLLIQDKQASLAKLMMLSCLNNPILIWNWVEVEMPAVLISMIFMLTLRSILPEVFIEG